MPRGIPKPKIYYVVEEGIPMPPRSYKVRKAPPYPFDEMRVGDSFLVPPGADIGAMKKRMFKFIKKMEAKTGLTMSFGERRQDDGSMRIWRVK